MGDLKSREEKRKQGIIGSMIKDDAADTPTTPTEDKGSVAEKNLFAIRIKEKEETRSKRINFVVKPSVYEKAQKKCKEMGVSLNECVSQFLENLGADETK